MKVGLYFGSFNPVHIGHLIIADFVANNSSVQQVWFVVSPQNPLKQSSSLLNEYHRLHLVNLAIEGNDKFRAVDIEFKLPKPSYTIDTVTYLQEKYPIHSFTIIMGSDSFKNIGNWKNHDQLLKLPIVIYERPGHEISQAEVPSNISILKAPLLEISATSIREQIRKQKSIRYLVPDAAIKEIEIAGYYK